MRNLATCVARGEPFLERACHRGAVVVLRLEEKRAEVANHFRNMERPDRFIHIDVARHRARAEGIAALANAIALYQPCWSSPTRCSSWCACALDDYAELTRELGAGDRLARRTGGRIAVTHHLGKMTAQGGDDVLGSTAIFGAVDTLVLFRRRKDNLACACCRRSSATVPIWVTVIPMDDTGRSGWARQFQN